MNIAENTTNKETNTQLILEAVSELMKAKENLSLIETALRVMAFDVEMKYTFNTQGADKSEKINHRAGYQFESKRFRHISVETELRSLKRGIKNHCIFLNECCEDDYLTHKTSIKKFTKDIITLIKFQMETSKMKSDEGFCLQHSPEVLRRESLQREIDKIFIRDIEASK